MQFQANLTVGGTIADRTSTVQESLRSNKFLCIQYIYMGLAEQPPIKDLTA